MISNKVRVVHLSAYYSPHIGGVETHLKEICEQHKQLGFQTTIITQKYHKSLSSKQKIDGVSIIRIPNETQKIRTHSNLKTKTKYKIAIWKSLWQHRKVLQSADLIHIHDVFFWLLPFFRWMPLFGIIDRKKCFITFHGYEGDQPSFTQRMWHQIANYFCSGSLAIGLFHERWYGVKATMTSFGGVDPILLSKKSGIKKFVNKTDIQNQSESSGSRTPNSDNSKKNAFLYVGRLAEDTGILVYLKAFRNVQRVDPTLSLDIYGTGPLESEAKKLTIKYQIKANFHPPVENIIKIYHQYHGLFASGYLTILDSLAVGTPVIAQYQSEIRENYLRDTPFAKWINIAGSQKAVEWAIKDIITKDLSNHILDGQKWARKQTWNELSKQYLQLWKIDEELV